ncbi:hypothetical protein STEG23_035653 [Scotinomys teguina]
MAELQLMENQGSGTRDCQDPSRQKTGRHGPRKGHLGRQVDGAWILMTLCGGKPAAVSRCVSRKTDSSSLLSPAPPPGLIFSELLRTQGIQASKAALVPQGKTSPRKMQKVSPPSPGPQVVYLVLCSQAILPPHGAKTTMFSSQCSSGQR